MARSAEALKKRAAKRNRSEKEQRKADTADVRRRREKELVARGGYGGGGSGPVKTNVDRPRHTSCTNVAGPATAAPKRFVTPPRRKVRHDKHTSKFQKWAKQAGPEQIAHNAELRKRYVETNGEGMSVEDINRAKTLIARDERKRAKQAKGAAKKKKKQKAMNDTDLKQKDIVDELKSPVADTTAKKAKNDAKKKKEEKKEAVLENTKQKKEVGDESKPPAAHKKPTDTNTKQKKEVADELESPVAATPPLPAPIVPAASDELPAEPTGPLPPPSPQPAQPAPRRREKRPTPMDLAWRQVALDEAAGRLPPFVAETEVERRLERIGENNKRSLEELARIRKLFADDDVDAGLEAIGKHIGQAPNATISIETRSTSKVRTVENKNDDQSSVSPAAAPTIKPKTVGKAMKKALKAAPNHSMKLKKLRKSVQTTLAIKKCDKKELKKAIEARIGEKTKRYKLNGKMVSLIVSS